MQKRSLIIFSFSILLLLSACINRYDEGPAVNMWPVKDKLINTWRWSYAVEDNNNLTGELRDLTLEFTKDDEVKTCDMEGNCIIGKWHLISKKQKLNLVYGDSAIAYEIQRIKFKELWLLHNDTINFRRIKWELVDADK